MRKPSKTAAIKGRHEVPRRRQVEPARSAAEARRLHRDARRPPTSCPTATLDNRPVLLIGDEEGGSIFPTWEAAFKAVESSIRYEIANGLRWS
jgi:hypothetical protein